MNKRRNVAFGNIDPDEEEFYGGYADKPREAREIVIEPGDPDNGDPGACDPGASGVGSFDSGSGSGPDLGNTDPGGIDPGLGSGLLGLGALERGSATREELIMSELSDYAKTNPEAIAMIIKEMFRKDE